MEPQNTNNPVKQEMGAPKMSALDFFLHLGVIVVLYVMVGFLLNLVFTVINVAYPQVATNYYYYQPSISFPVAALIVLFPLFVLLSWLVYRSYDVDIAKKHLSVRKWLTYLTLFLTGGVIAGDLITVIYYYLDGQELSVSFMLKALTLLLVSLVIFSYYLRDLQSKISSAQRKIWTIIAAVMILLSIIAGFWVIGSPRNQRLMRYDAQKVSDLQNIQSQILSYWQMKGILPVTLDALRDSTTYFSIPLDSQTGKQYEYSTDGKQSFRMCATFNLKSANENTAPRVSNAMYYVGMENENWKHDVGYTCFSRTVDPERYPVIKR